MARISFAGIDQIESQLAKMGRPMVRKIVEAGGRAATERMRSNIESRRHIRTGDMMQATGMAEYVETLGGGSVDVYPLGEDRKGERNATKAYVINYGVKGNQHPRSADRFITGDTARAKEIVQEAMRKESSRLIEEISR